MTIRRNVAVICGAFTILPLALFAQPADQCPECKVGIWQGSFASNFNFFGETFPAYPIEVRFGKWSSGGEPVQAFEFSITNLENFIVSFDPPPGATLVMGTPPAPADTTGTETGGMMLAWDECLGAGDITVMSIYLTPLDPFVTNHVLWTTHRFPPSVAETAGPTFTQCGADEPTEATGGCYVVNVDGTDSGTTIDGCFIYAPLAVEETPWTRIKTLYR